MYVRWERGRVALVLIQHFLFEPKIAVYITRYKGS